jgi:hydrogenase maturation protease
MKTLILGLGNFLLSDEGVGIHAIKALEKEQLPDNVDLMDGGTGGFHLLSWFEQYERIIMIDATLDDNPPGTVRMIKPRYSSDFPPLLSAHEIGIKDMVDVMQITDSFPEIELIVVSASKINEIGMELTPEIEKSIPQIIEKIKISMNN